MRFADCGTPERWFPALRAVSLLFRTSLFCGSCGVRKSVRLLNQGNRLSDRPWQQEERQVAHLLHGKRYPANSGRRVDVERDRLICQVKHRRTCSLAPLEALAIELDELGRTQNKLGIVCIKRRAGRGSKTPRLIVMTEAVWCLIKPDLIEETA